jgi:hypothetical protein
MITAFLLPLLYSPIFYFTYQDVAQFGLFVLGVYGGAILMWLDQVVLHKYYAAAVDIVPTAPHLITRSPMFIAVYVPLALFVITSSGSALGIGLIQGIGLQMSYELIKYSRDPAAFSRHFYQAFHKVTLQESLLITWVFVGIFAALSLLVFV